MIHHFKQTRNVLAVLALLIAGATAKDLTLLNASFDPTRELYASVNAAFAAQWKAQTGDTVTLELSNGGSGKQARAVIDGLQADVVTLGLAYDIDAIAEKSRLLPADWQKRLPNNSAPYTSTIVFLVRAGNPKNIHDWDDLIKSDVKIVSPNPKTSGGARWNFLAGWGYALKKYGSKEKARDYVASYYQHVPILDSGARGATNTFVQRELGDVLVGWESDALLSVKKYPGKYEVIYPSLTILAEPTVALIDVNVDKRGTRTVAEAYLKFLYTPEGQELIAKNYFRPRSAEVAQKYAVQFPAIKTFTIDDTFGGWQNAQWEFFSDTGVFDSLYKPNAVAH